MSPFEREWLKRNRPIHEWAEEDRFDEYRRREQAELERLNRENGVITSPFELVGFAIVEIERYKPGVVRYRAQRQTGTVMEQRIGFAKDEVFGLFPTPSRAHDAKEE